MKDFDINIVLLFKVSQGMRYDLRFLKIVLSLNWFSFAIFELYNKGILVLYTECEKLLPNDSPSVNFNHNTYIKTILLPLTNYAKCLFSTYRNVALHWYVYCLFGKPDWHLVVNLCIIKTALYRNLEYFLFCEGRYHEDTAYICFKLN